MKTVSACFILMTSFLLGQERDPIDSVSKHMESCPSNEVRLLYFLHDSIGIRMVMTIDLSKYSVYMARDVFDHAHQNSKTRELSHTQIEKIKRILKELPATTEQSDAQTLYLAYWLDGRLDLKKYSRQRPPSQVDLLYDIVGGYLDIEDRKIEPSDGS